MVLEKLTLCRDSWNGSTYASVLLVPFLLWFPLSFRPTLRHFGQTELQLEI